METILVLGDLDATDETTRFLVELAERNNVRVVKMTRQEYDSVTAASEDAVRRDFKSRGVDLHEGDWNDEATQHLHVRLRDYLVEEREVKLATIRAIIVIPSSDYGTDWWPFDAMNRGHDAMVAANS